MMIRSVVMVSVSHPLLLTGHKHLVFETFLWEGKNYVDLFYETGKFNIETESQAQKKKGGITNGVFEF